MPQTQTNLQTIADRAGVSRSAVSLALRGQPGVSAAVRERINSIAKEQGYRPNPMVSALMAHLKGAQPCLQVTSIPYLTAHSAADGWRADSSALRCFNGARDRALQLGYRLDEVWLREPGMTARKMRDILKHRGVLGILLGPLPSGMGHVSMDLESFSVATFGHSIILPKLHRVVGHHVASMRSVLHEVNRLGYKRVGLALGQSEDRSNAYNWSMSYVGHQHMLPSAARVPILDTGVADDKAVRRWWEKWKPDVIVSGNSAFLGVLARVGISVPRDAGFAVLDRRPGEEGVAGIDQQCEVIGADAIDIIVGQINRNERGLPATPKVTLIEGVWVPGATLAARRSKGLARSDHRRGKR